MPNTEPRPELTAAGAQLAIATATATATEIDVAVVIVAADSAGNPVAMLRMDGAPLFSVTVAEKKAWTAAAAGARTIELGASFADDPVLLHALAPKVPDLMAVGGAAPIVVDGKVAGAVGVSGATEAQDQAIADAAAESV